MSEVDPVEFGKAVAKLESAVERIDEVASLQREHTARIVAIEERFTFGKGGLFGIAIGIAFMLYGVKQTIVQIAAKVLG